MFIHITLLLNCYVYLSIKQLFPLYMCICSLACCPSRALDWLIKYIWYLIYGIKIMNVISTQFVVLCFKKYTDGQIHSWLANIGCSTDSTDNVDQSFLFCVVFSRLLFSFCPFSFGHRGCVAQLFSVKPAVCCCVNSNNQE